MKRSGSARCRLLYDNGLYLIIIYFFLSCFEGGVELWSVRPVDFILCVFPLVSLSLIAPFWRYKTVYFAILSENVLYV